MFKIYLQRDQMDCGPACLAMIASRYGKEYDLQYLHSNSYITREGVSLAGITEAAEKIGFETLATKLTIDTLSQKKTLLPCILHWNQNHFVVLYKITHLVFTGKKLFKIADPGYGFVSLSETKFCNHWLSNENEGVGLFLHPTEKFYQLTPSKEKKLTLRFLFGYLKPHKLQLSGMLFLLFLGSCISLFFPFLTQYLIDKGVNAKDMNFIVIILIAQLALFLGSIIIEIFRNWIMLIVGTKINIRIISDFLKKLFSLPISFFDTKLMGDFNQRIADHERIENFLTSQSLLTFFSMITFLVFFGVLWYYDIRILFVYLSLTIVSVIWSLFWMKRRKILDYIRFQIRSENQEAIYEIIGGVSEMKLNQFEDFKRKEWEKIQQKLFKTNIRILKLDQVQTSGFNFLNQIKNIIVTLLAASLVVKGNMTLGSLLSVSYIIGQMNSPINQLVSFFRSLQDAKLSLLRLNEVQQHPEEEQEDQYLLFEHLDKVQNHIEQQPITTFQRSIALKKISFQYEGPKSSYVLKDIDFIIPEGKITAIVGSSGSGKTTLMKLLLKFYSPVQGCILFGNENLINISPLDLRKNCGVVMQDGFIFADTIERNIVCGDESIDYEKLNKAIKIANIEKFVKNLPLGLNTKIGASGNGISGGEKQRILIARAVYKNPVYIFFDEATSALDAENEKTIHDNLEAFFHGKTVLIIAHRLSTVKKADQIIVLKNGQIVEKGNHTELVNKKTDYFNLIKNQLELGS
jgi:ATP-binding cassette, subfamily B, bacterial